MIDYKIYEKLVLIQGFAKVKAPKQAPPQDGMKSAEAGVRHWKPDGNPSKKAPRN
jgi:hypothetical protein